MITVINNPQKYVSGIILSILLFTMLSDASASPTIQMFPSETQIFTNEHTVSKKMGIILSYPEGGQLTLTCESSNNILVPPDSFFILSEARNEYTLTVSEQQLPTFIDIQIKPALHQSGNSTITIKLEDENSNIQNLSFDLIVNGKPVISSISDHLISDVTESYDIDFQISDPETASEQLEITLLTSNSDILPIANISLDFIDQGPDAKMIISPISGQSGSVMITIQVSDHQIITEQSFMVQIVGVPVVQVSQEWSVPVNAVSAPIPFSICDSDGGPVTLTIQSSNPVVISDHNVLIQGAYSGYSYLTSLTLNECKSLFFTVQSNANKMGFSVLTIQVDDGLAIGSAEIKLVVMNTPPVISFIPAQTMNMNTTSEPIAVSVSDAEGGMITLTCWSDQLISSGTCSNNSGSITSFSLDSGDIHFISNTLTPDENAFGIATINILLTDGLLSSSSSFTLTVNSPPQIQSHDTAIINMNSVSSPFNLTVIDKDQLLHDLQLSFDYTCTSLFPENSITYECLTETCTLFFTPEKNQGGACNITVTAFDGIGYDVIPLTIHMNERPSLSDIPAQESNEDEAVSITMTIADDNPLDQLNFQVMTQEPLLLSSVVQIDDSHQKVYITLYPEKEVSGQTIVTVTVSDPHMLSYSQTFEWNVLNVEDPPVIDSHLLPSYRIEENTSLSLTVLLKDPDSDQSDLRLKVNSNNVGLISSDCIEIYKNGNFRTIIMVPGSDQFGTATITFIVDHESMPESQSIYSITLTVSPKNRRPVVNSDFTVIPEDYFYVYQIEGSDYEHSPLWFSITTEPVNGRIIDFNQLTGSFRYVPFENFNGTEYISYIANDGTDNSDPGTLTITVTSVNDVPVAFDHHYTILKNQHLTFYLEANDVDTEDAMFYRLTQTTQTIGLPDIENFDTGFAQYTPKQNFTGEDWFGFYVKDNKNAYSNIAIISIDIIDSFVQQYTLTINVTGAYQESDYIDYAILDSTDNHEVLSGKTNKASFIVSLVQGNYRLILIGDGYEPYEYQYNDSKIIDVYQNKTIECNISKNEHFHPYEPKVQVSKTLRYNGFDLRMVKENFTDMFVMKINDHVINTGNEKWPYTYQWTVQSSPFTVSASNTPYTGDLYYQIRFDFYDYNDYVDSYTVTYYQIADKDVLEEYKSADRKAFEEDFGNGGAYSSKAIYDTEGQGFFYPYMGTSLDLYVKPGTGGYTNVVIDIPRIPLEYLVIDDKEYWKYDEATDFYDVVENSTLKLSPSTRLKVKYSHYAFAMTIASGIAIDFYIDEGPYKNTKVRYNPMLKKGDDYERFSDAPTIAVPLLLNSNYNKFDTFSEALLNLMNTFPALVDEKGDGAYLETETYNVSRFQKVQLPFILENKIIVYLQANHLTRFAALWSSPVEEDNPSNQYFHADSIDSGGCFIESLFK